jgi:RNA polymerase sigma factor (sigma-70 family)
VDSITTKVLEFQRQGKHLSYLIEELGKAAYNFPSKRNGFDEDDRGDFYLFVFPKTIKLLHQFRYSGKSFESYLNTVLKWQFRSYLRRREKSRHIDTVKKKRYYCYSEEPVISVAEPLGGLDFKVHNSLLKSINFFLRLDKDGKLTESAVRRVLILCLKEYHFVDETLLKKVSLLIDYDLEKLRQMFDTMHFMMERRQERVRKLQETRNNLYFTLLTKQEKVSLQIDPEKRTETYEMCRKIKTRLEKIDKRFPRALLYPPNKLIAEILNIPKGSVDSGLYYVRKVMRGRRQFQIANF